MTATDSPEPTLPPTINRTIDLFTLKPELVKCQYFVAAFEALASDIRALLPKGYELDATTSAAAGEVQIQVDLCEAIKLNNETVISNAALLVVESRVRVDKSLAAGAEFHQYAFEILSSNQTVVNLWNNLGFTAGLAEVAISSGPPYTLSVSVSGNMWYQVTGARWTPFTGSETTLDIRSHQVRAPNSARWFDYTRSDQLPNDSGRGTIQVTGGIVKALDPSDQGVIPASSWLGASRGTIEFGRS